MPPLKFVANLRARERNPNSLWEQEARDCAAKDVATVEAEMREKYPPPYVIRTRSYRTSGRRVYPATYRYIVRAYLRAKFLSPKEPTA